MFSRFKLGIFAVKSQTSILDSRRARSRFARQRATIEIGRQRRGDSRPRLGNGIGLKREEAVIVGAGARHLIWHSRRKSRGCVCTISRWWRRTSPSLSPWPHLEHPDAMPRRRGGERERRRSCATLHRQAGWNLPRRPANLMETRNCGKLRYLRLDALEISHQRRRLRGEGFAANGAGRLFSGFSKRRLDGYLGESHRGSPRVAEGRPKWRKLFVQQLLARYALRMVFKLHSGYISNREWLAVKNAW